MNNTIANLITRNNIRKSGENLKLTITDRKDVAEIKARKQEIIDYITREEQLTAELQDVEQSVSAWNNYWFAHRSNPCAVAPATEWQTILATKSAIAQEYYYAKSQATASNSDKASAGRRAVERILCGDTDVESIKAEREDWDKSDVWGR